MGGNPRGQRTGRGPDRGLILAVAGVLLLPTVTLATGATGPAAFGDTGQGCLASQDLVAVMGCLKAAMPGKDSQGYQVPTEEDLDRWREATTRLLTLPCLVAQRLDPTGPAFEIAVFEDDPSGRSYCVLHEVGDADGVVDRGWGAVIVDQAPDRDVHLQVPHPVFDLETPEQGAGVLRGAGAASMVIAGAHRYANDAEPGEHAPSDVAHRTDSPFHAAVEAIVAHRGTLPASPAHVQFHGMAADSCPGVDVYLTRGTTEPPDPGDPLLGLRDALRAQVPDWTVIVSGDPPGCHLSGTTNVQGQHTNAQGQLWVHVESDPEDRVAGPWVAALQALGLGEPLA